MSDAELLVSINSTAIMMSYLTQSFLSFIGYLSESWAQFTTLMSLRTRVANYLTVFDDPRYAPLDVPDWVHRIMPHVAPADRKFTVRKLIRSMCDSAFAVELAEGERYVLTTVCACAEKSHGGQRMGTGLPREEAEREALARGLQDLANAWVAFLLWPFFARMEDPECVTRGYASPCTGLAYAPKAMAYGDFDPDECLLESSYPLRDQVLLRDGFRYILTGHLSWENIYEGQPPPEAIPGYVDAVRIFKHPLVVYKDIYANDKAKRESIMLSMDLLQRFCQPSDKCIQDMGQGIMDDPGNLISLYIGVHGKFDSFAVCLVPTQIANTYRVKDHDPQFRKLHRIHPWIITFRDRYHSKCVGDVESQPQPQVRLPDRELLRMHAALGSVLYTSGVVEILTRILDHLHPDRPDVDDIPVPRPDGSSFWKVLMGHDPDINRLVQLLRAEVTEM